MAPPGKSVYYYYRLLDKSIDQHLLLQDYSVRWYSGYTPHFKLGSGAGRWWPALALLLAIHGTFWWTTTVDYQQCAVNLRGGRLGPSKETCYAASALADYAEVSYPSPTSLRYYTPTITPPSPTRDVFEDTKHGNMLNARNRAAPPRKLTATPAKAPHHNITEADLRGHLIKVTIVGIIWVALGCLIGHMQRGADDARTTGPPTGIQPVTHLSANTFVRCMPGST